MATLAETLADPSRPSFLFGTFILLSSITLFCISHDKKIEQICSFLSFKLALFSFSAISDDIRKRSIGNDGFSLRSLLDMVMMIKESYSRTPLSEGNNCFKRRREKEQRGRSESLPLLLPKRSILFFSFTNNVFIAFFLTDD